MIPDGHYARKQIHCPNPVVAWSHRSRFRLAARLASVASGGRLLDYGCGDGTFIARTHGMFRETVGADADADQIADCRQRFAAVPAVRFVVASRLGSGDLAGAFDAVMCMEVLEHCTDVERVRVLDELGRLVKRDGRVIVSVPIEIGPALAGKQLFRAIAARLGHGDYRFRETYTPGELVAAVLARPNLSRAQYRDTPGGQVRYCGHKGFDWRVLARELQSRFVIERRVFSPMSVFGPILNSQVWFVCGPRLDQ